MGLMYFHELNELLKKLQVKLQLPLHPKRKVLLYTQYLNTFLTSNSPDLLYPFFADCIEGYLSSLKLYTPYFTPPEITQNIIAVLNSVKETELFLLFKEETETRITELDKQLQAYLKLLTEPSDSVKETAKAWFPVIETGGGENEFPLGFTEYVTVELKTSKTEDEIFIMPGGVKAEEELHRQVLHSLGLAYEILYPGTERKNHFTVWLLFHEQHGSYTGTSLGISLTLALLEALSVYNNNTHLFKLNPGIAFTGSIAENGAASILPEGIIENKTEVCFYSSLKMLVVPRENEADARAILTKLQLVYPARKLNILGIENIDDLLSRRNLIDIQKQSAIKRGAKNVISSKYHILFFALSLTALALIMFYDFDNNPALLLVDRGLLSVKNKYSRVLWRKKIHEINRERISKYAMIIDTEKDGTNEVILTCENFLGTEYENENGRIVCYNADQTIKWKYYFHDTIETKEEMLQDYFGLSQIFDTTTINNDLKIVLWCTNVNSFAGVVYKLNLNTGVADNERLYHAGHIVDGLIKKFPDGKNYAAFTGVNNSAEKGFAAVINTDSLNGLLPIVRPQYEITGKNFINPYRYILFPKSDYCNYLGLRNNGPTCIRFVSYSGKSKFEIIVVEDAIGHGFNYNFSEEFTDCEVVIGSDFQVLRDSLIAKGKLSSPYTDTAEYCLITKKRILIWDGEKFVEMFK